MAKRAKNDNLEILMVAGEQSGDELGAEFIVALKEITSWKFWGVGGKKMRMVGQKQCFDFEELSVIGVVAILGAYFRLRKRLFQIVENAKKKENRIAILIDFPGFNLRLAKELKKYNFFIFHLSSPQIWMWRYNRIKKIKAYEDAMLLLYPFEKEIYDRENHPAWYIGHPLVDRVRLAQRQLKENGNKILKNFWAKNKLLIGLFPGSREMEIKYLWPLIFEMAISFYSKHPETVFLVSVANAKVESLIKKKDLPPFIRLIRNKNDDLMDAITSGIAASGTVTTQLALFKKPFFIIYKGPALSYFLLRKTVKRSVFGMVNILSKKYIVQEFLQYKITKKNLLDELEKITFDKIYRKEMIQNLKKATNLLGSGNSIAKGAKIFKQQIYKFLES